MEYMLLIYAEESSLPEMTGELVAEYQAYNAELEHAGAFLAANRLRPSSTATSQRVEGGAVTTTDGPFAETKEQLVGYYLIDCDDLDAALSWASRLPASRIGTVEVRPVIPTAISCETEPTA